MMKIRHTENRNNRIKENNYQKIYLEIVIGLLFLLFLVKVLFPLLEPNDPIEVNMSDALLAPCRQYPFGTDRLGRCVLSRILEGAYTSISITFGIVLIATILGTIVGFVAGFSGGWIDGVVMRITDVFLAFPNLILAYAVAGMLGQGLFNASLAIIFTSWTKYARLSRSLIVMERKKPYVIGAGFSGAGSIRKIMVYMLPNMLPQLVTVAASDIGGKMLSIAGLSFLGIGAQAPSAEWGYMLYEGKSMLQIAPWMSIFPGIAIFLTVLIFNLFSDHLRDVLDPQR